MDTQKIMEELHAAIVGHVQRAVEKAQGDAVQRADQQSRRIDELSRRIDELERSNER